MTDLKPGWQRVKFGEVVRLNKETCKDPEAAGINRVIGLEHLEPGDLRVRSWADVADGTTFSNRVRPGQVLFGKRRAYQRKVAVADFDAICSGDIYVFETADQTQLLQELLPYICQTDSFFEYAVGTSAGSLSPRTNWKSLAAYEFALPPLEEQRRMIITLNALAELVYSLSEARRCLEIIEHTAAQKAFEAYALSYPVRPLGEGCLRVTDGTHQPPPFSTSGIPFFLVKTISGGNVDWSHTKFVSHETYAELTRRVKPERGHVLYTAVGTYGVAKLVDFDMPFAFQRHIAHIIPDNSKLLGEYIELFLNSPQGKRLSDKHAIGSAQPTVTLRSLSSFPLPIPSVEDQAELVERIDSIRSAKHDISRRLEATHSIRLTAIREWSE